MNDPKQIKDLLRRALDAAATDEEDGTCARTAILNLCKLRAAEATDMTLVLVSEKAAAKLEGKTGNEVTLGQVVDAMSPLVDLFTKAAKKGG